jgi:hypothetical protein
MLDRSRIPGKKRDLNETAFGIVDQLARRSEGEAVEDEDGGKDPAAVALGRRGGLKGGKARAANMTPEERSEAARRAAVGRWAKKPPGGK